jgi:radical SAM superfamily enzyme YgiQ (UPF0313 family)
MAEDTLQYCDVVVRQEGDETLLEVLQCLTAGAPLNEVAGIAYWDHDRIRVNQDRPYVRVADTIPDLDLIPGYLDWSLPKRLWRKRNHLQLLQTSRGCPYKCSFCIAPRELGSDYRLRSIDSVIKDIKYQIEYTNAKRFFIVDNHFTLDRSRTKELLQRIVDEGIDWTATCFTRIEVANDEELLGLLKKARVEVLYIGLESFDDEVLRLLNKKQTGDGVREALRKIRAAGLRPLGSFVVGTDDETLETIELTVNTAIEEDLEYMVLFPLGGFPERNSPTVPLNRFLIDSWDRVDATHVTYLPKNMRPSTLQRAINRAYERFYGASQIWRRFRQGDFRSGLQRIAFSYFASRLRRGTEQWAKHLQTLEGPYYDDRDQLIEDTLGEGIHPARYPGNRRADVPTAPIAAARFSVEGGDVKSAII